MTELHDASSPDGATRTRPTVQFPPGNDSWLSPTRVDYLAKFAQMLFFLLALPYLGFKVLTAPLTTMRNMSASHGIA